MDGTGEHYVKWNKPGGEGQIPYDLTFNWNKSTKEKSKQNITRDIELKSNLTIARGEWGGDNGERGLQELLERTHGQNQGGGWRWGREVRSARVGGGGMGRKGRQL